MLPPLLLCTNVTDFVGSLAAFSPPRKGRPTRSVIDLTGYEVRCSLPDDTVLVLV